MLEAPLKQETLAAFRPKQNVAGVQINTWAGKGERSGTYLTCFVRNLDL